MKVLILPDAAAVTARAADLVADQLAVQPDMVLGLATGGTMVPLYDELVRRYRDGLLSFAAVTSFNLDEYIGLASSHPCSYHSYMMKALVELTDMQCERAGECCGDAGAGAGAVGLGLEALLQQSRSWQQVSGEG